MLRFETTGDVDRIEGDSTDLLALAIWLRIAVERGTARTPGYHSGDHRQRVVEIVCTGPLQAA